MPLTRSRESKRQLRLRVSRDGISGRRPRKADSSLSLAGFTGFEWLGMTMVMG
jgi:hypothetical protein